MVSLQPIRQCKICGLLLPKGKKEYCSDKCFREGRREYLNCYLKDRRRRDVHFLRQNRRKQKAYTFLYRYVTSHDSAKTDLSELSTLSVSIPCTDIFLPDTKNYEELWKSYQKLKGYTASGLIDLAREEALLLEAFLSEDESLEAGYLRAYCDYELIKVAIDMNTPQSIRDGKIRFFRVAKFWAVHKEWLELSKTVNQFADLNRTEGNYKEALKFNTGALHILEGLCSSNKKRARSLHRCLETKLRLLAYHLKNPLDSESERCRDLMVQTAKDNFAGIEHTFTLREEAWYWASVYNRTLGLKLDHLAEELKMARGTYSAFFSENPVLLSRFFRPEIELLLCMGEKNEASMLAQKHIEMCRKYSLGYHSRWLEEMNKKHNFGLNIQEFRGELL